MQVTMIVPRSNQNSHQMIAIRFFQSSIPCLFEVQSRTVIRSQALSMTAPINAFIPTFIYL